MNLPRVPFLLSFIVVTFSYLIRRKMAESPLFEKMKASGKASTNPLQDSFLVPENRKLVIIALFGATAGQGVVWYTDQFYALQFLQTVLRVEFETTNIIIAVALLLAPPFFIFFGHMSDKIGFKKIIMSGCLIAALSYNPIYRTMTAASGWDPANPLAPAFNPSVPELIGLVFIQVFFVTMLYGPSAAFQIELFPTRIRYPSMSLSYHIGNGVFGGLVPFIATALVAESGNIYIGLMCPNSVALIAFCIGCYLIHEQKNRIKMNEEVL